MPITQETKPIEDSVPKVNNELAVGEDLPFQRRWWKIERAMWVFFTVLLLLDIAGVFGRGPVAKAHARTSDGSLQVSYERIERYGTPSVLTARFGPGAVHNNQAQLWVSESLVTRLGNQRIIPQPLKSVIDEGGIAYTFDATPKEVTVQFALEPAKAGISELKMQVPGSELLAMKIMVMP